jgi:hypothetical protein
MELKRKITNILAIVVLPLITLGLAGFTCKSIIEQDIKASQEVDQINQCHKLLAKITDQYDFDKLESKEFEVAHKCFSENRSICSDYKRDGLEFAKKLFVIKEFQSQFEALKNAPQLEKELFLLKLNRVMMVSDDYCYKGSCKRLGKSFICAE